MKNIITNIQRFCLQDGPGIRTVVFFKGCNLNCPWCSNPENISFEIEKSIDNKIIYGKEYSVEELYKEIVKDKIYYDKDGGVTFSGGEPLFHSFEIKELLKRLNKDNISVAVETTATTPVKYLKEIIDYVDYFLIDIKILYKEDSSKININIDNFYNNIKILEENNKKIFYRIPLVRGYTYTKENIELIKKFLNDNNVKEVDVFNVHELGSSKYELLGKKMNHFDLLNAEDFEHLKKEFNDIKINILEF